MKKRIMGIDAATKKTGYSVFDNDGNLIKYGLIKSNLSDIRERMREIHIELSNIIKGNNIEVVVIEDIPMNSHNNLQTAKDLAILHGVIIGICFELCLPCVVYLPSSWRSLVGTYDGTREGTKREVQKQAAVDKVNELYNLNFKYYKSESKDKKSDDDIAEAILIAKAYFLENKED